jgi:hypothetical protein
MVIFHPKTLKVLVEVLGVFLPKGVSANCIGAGLAPEAPGANYL